MAFLETYNHPFEVIKYLENPLTFTELEVLLTKLKIQPIALVRTKESIWLEQFKGKSLTDNEIIQSMVDYPILMERPIAVYGEKAVIARPLELIMTIL